MTGYTDASIQDSPYFYIDFTQSNTYVWDETCQYQVSAIELQPCADAPLLLEASYQGNATRKLGEFTDAYFNGYTASGNIYWDEYCVGESSCTYLEVYSVTMVYDSQYMIGVDGAFGVLGYGPKSTLWNALTDPST